MKTIETLNRGATPHVLISLAAFISFLLSVSLWFTGNEDQGVFVGLWVPSILAVGAYAAAATRRRA